MHAESDQDGNVTLQLTNLHGDVVASASSDETATSLQWSGDQSEFGVPRSAGVDRYGWLGGLERATDPDPLETKC